MPQQNTLPSQKRRYTIVAQLRNLEQARSSHIRDTIVNEMGIDRSTYYRWIKISKSDFTDIPGRALRRFAQLFRVPMEELFNDNN